MHECNRAHAKERPTLFATSRKSLSVARAPLNWGWWISIAPPFPNEGIKGPLPCTLVPSGIIAAELKLGTNKVVGGYVSEVGFFWRREMRKIATLAIASALSIGTLGLAAAPSEASHRHRDRDGDGISLQFRFGSPYYYGHPYAYGPYRAYPVAPRRHYGAMNAHVAWCYDRWRSYRASDNTYQPYNGPRRECRSPYWG